jgi:hypothetical protein
MASNPKMEYQVFICILQTNLAMATLGMKEMGKGLPWLSLFGKCKKSLVL